MQLKKLLLLGFKTFADKTELIIDSGLTAIVGPNGSGKSNIADALLWVLGEQNPRLIRGDRAQDVIFTGSERRKPLGLAEVRLTLDNSDRSIPLRFEEICITRRVYRSGESQYLINGAACRLKDIVELFLDTGAGRGAYAVVGQNEIDAVLSVKAEERRSLFEEAAGVKKYRVKKQEALRKLAAAESNLQRVRDIIRELDVQCAPLEKQAQDSLRYLELQERLRVIESGLLIAEVKQTDYDLFGSREEREDSRDHLLQIEAEQARLEHASKEIGQNLSLAESDLDSAQMNRQQLLSSVERMESRRALLTERIRAAGQSSAQRAEELEVLDDELIRIQRIIEQDQKELEAADAAGVERARALMEQRALLQVLEAKVSAALSEIEEIRSAQNRMAEERAARQAAASADMERLAEAETEYQTLCTEMEQLQNYIAATKLQLELAINLQSEEKEAGRALAETLQSIESRRQSLHQSLSTARTSLDTVLRELSEKKARLSALIELQQNYEGFYQGVKAVLNAKRKGVLPGTYQPVVDIFQVPEPYRVAIETALGGSLQDIVTHTESEAKAGIEWLKQNRAGRATFLPLPLLRPGRVLEYQASPGIEGTALRLIQFSQEYRPAAELLLGRVVVASSMDSALSASLKLAGWSKIVTLEGELLTPGGALTGGSLQGRGAHLVGRKGEIDDLRSRIPTLNEEAERRKSVCDGLEQDLLIEEQNRAAQERSLSAKQTAEAAAGMSVRSLERDLNRLEQDSKTQRSEQSALLSRIEALRMRTAQYRTKQEEAADEQADGRENLAAVQERVNLLLSERDAVRLAAVTIEVEVSALKSHKEGLQRTLQDGRSSLENLKRRRLKLESQHQENDIETMQSASEQEQLTEKIASIRIKLQEAEKQLSQNKEQRQKLLNLNFEIGNDIQQTSKRRAEITSALHESELLIARLEMQQSQALEKLQLEYGINLEEALADPASAEIDKSDMQEAGKLRREIRGMGPVNTGAHEEYERLTERCKFLIEQQGDLEDSRAGLLTTISEIDVSTKDIFLETFESVKIEFQSLFSRLFGGGYAQLHLTNPDDLMETGIEIIAQPPGKKAQSLALLSGGERALTAAALLFSFLAVKPSPFVLLDEVDAPLDGANVEKFAQLLRDFSARSQFLIITHNPVTMEAAPTWYGVTMREPGVSSLLSYRMPEEAVVVIAPDSPSLTQDA